MKFTLKKLFLCIALAAAMISWYRFVTAQPKFHHEQPVIVTKGYFKNRTGNVVGCYSQWTTYHYAVRTPENQLLGAKNQPIPESALSAIKP